MNDEQVRQIDQLAEQALGNSTGPERSRAESVLKDLKTLENLPALRYVLERSQSQYSHFVCSKTMLEIVTENWNAFAAQGQSHNELRTWLVSFIGQRGHTLEKFVLTSVMSILCRVTRLGWLDNESFQELPQEIHSFFICSKTSPDHPAMGLMLLNQLVVEVNTTCSKLTLSQHRKTIVSFRDKCLLEIFKVALASLESAANAGKSPREVEMGVLLTLSCLTFDFVGIFADESCEDVGTVQIPSTWKALLLDAKTMQMFWKLYEVLPPPHSTNILKCVVQFASVRRSLFADDQERSQWLGGILSGILSILRGKTGLNNEPNYHEFCRLLSRIKPNYQLAELVNVPYYDEWIQLTATFTIDSFVNWQNTSSSSYFLLSLWARLLAALPYLKTGKPPLLEQYAPDVVFSYIQSRLNLARATVETPNEVENSLEDNDMLLVQLESLPVIARSLYEKVGPYLMSMAMPDYNTMKDLIVKVQSGTVSPEQQQQEFLNLQILDCRLSWMVYMMGSIVSHHSAVGSSDPEAEGLDGQLTALVLELSKVVISRLSIPGQTEMSTLQRLQSAILYFVNGFRKVYIGDTSIPCSKVYPKLKELTGLEDSIGVLRVIVDIILSILKGWVKCQRLINESLSLFLELSVGYSSGRSVMKLDTVKLLLQQHTHPSFAFVNEPQNLKQRTKFYKILANLLFRLTSSDGPFESFMKPLLDRANQLQQLQPQQYLQPDVKAAVIGWLRDVRGVLSACANKRTYGLLFDWVFPFISSYQVSQPPLLPKICQVYSQGGKACTDVLIPLLRLYSDLVYNQAQRITFDASSPNGILLFREASALLRTYGMPKLQELSPQSVGWNIVQAANMSFDEGFKGVNICMNILGRALHGSYCNFGVFSLYGDSALDDALEVVIKLMLTISIDDIIAYPKLGKSYYYLLEILFNSHTPSLLRLPSAQFLQVLLCLEKGIMSIELAKPVSLSAATAMGHLCSFYYQQTQKAAVGSTQTKACQSVQQLQLHLASDPGLLNRVLTQMFHIILFDEQANQWSISRPMLPLILVTDSQLQQYRQTLLGRITDAERQGRLNEAFEKLLEGVEANLEHKNRDKFTGNVTAFKHHVRFIL